MATRSLEVFAVFSLIRSKAANKLIVERGMEDENREFDDRNGKRRKFGRGESVKTEKNLCGGGGGGRLSIKEMLPQPLLTNHPIS